MSSEENRCLSTQNGLQRCIKVRGHIDAHQFNPLRSEALAVRKIQLSLTHTLARHVLTLARRERKRRERDYNRHPYIPAPGRFDANLAAMAMMDDIIQQLEKKVLEAA